MRCRSAAGTACEDGADLRRGPAQRHAGARGVLHQQPGATLDRVERLRDRAAPPAPRPLAVAGGRGARMKADAAHAQRGGALQLFPQPGPGAGQLGLVLGGGIQHIRGVHNDVLRGDPRLGQRRAKALDPLRPHGGLVAIVLWRGREDLQRPHPGVAGPERRHVDAAVGDRVGPDEAGPRDLLRQRLQAVTVRTADSERGLMIVAADASTATPDGG